MSRAERRREEKTAPAVAVNPWAALDGLWWAVLTVLVVMTGRATVHRITWYLAVDQLGYLTFANDLVHGRITHEWSVAKALASVLPQQTDMLAQTYIWNAGRMYCRYAPGFPIILATWMAFFGRFGAHYLNPTLYLVFIAVYAVAGWRMLGDRWRALVALTLLLLLPTNSHLWALTVTRDLCAHVFAWIGLLCMLPPLGGRLTAARVAVGGLAVGICACVRPDDIMYVVPALLLAGARWRQDGTAAVDIRRSLLAGGVALFVGMSPFFAYNWIATGNPLRATQAMELNMLFQPVGGMLTDAAPPPAPKPVPAPTPATAAPAAPFTEPKTAANVSPGWHGGTVVQIQGGGLRLANLPTTLPGLFALLNHGYSAAFMGLAIWGLALALIHRPLLVLAAVPYTVSALLLYGCWTRPDGRYVLGVHYFMPLLIAEGLFGTFDLRRLLPDAGGNARTVWTVIALLGALVFVGLALFTPVPVGYQGSSLPVLMQWIVLPGVALGFLCAMAWPEIVSGALVAGVIAVVLTGYVCQQASLIVARPSAGFQRGEMESARATLQRNLPPNSVVLSSEEIGRPMENIQFYSEVAQAIYQTDLARWRLPLATIVGGLAKAGMPFYWLMPIPKNEAERRMVEAVSTGTQLEKVMDIPKERAMDWFVAAAFHHGIPLELYKVTLPK